MAIEIDPTEASVTVTQTQPFQANSLWIDDLHVDGANRNAGPPSMQMVTTPCARPAPTEPPTVFASESNTNRTTNLWGAVANVPEIGVALVAVEAAAKALHVYNLARQADLDAANAALAAAQAAVVTASAACDETFAARDAAYKAGPLVGNLDDPAWLAAEQAWLAATASLATARATATAAQATVTVATAALADPANPKVQATP